MKQLFDIYKLTEEGAREIAASGNEPHQHDFEELLVGVESALDHFIDYESVEINAPFISFVTRGKVHRVVPKLKDGKRQIWAIRSRINFIKKTSFGVYHQILNDKGEIAAEAQDVMVMFDFEENGKAIAQPVIVKGQRSKVEGRRSKVLSEQQEQS
ncbi:hypothetical protein [Prolixibacter sp. SD074]|jgi:hypothetical protein|uniref:hypothetical protein n=1 Tax=Prolixibacter sp. SD074 TaxID=2652391 RepID=UPI0012898F4D|nr:hypothetical protein [Prolixibacter sp. SD074]GET28541.1 hypothetical protein SD074_07430 [Prolixibacter sp. SD074]